MAVDPQERYSSDGHELLYGERFDDIANEVHQIGVWIGPSSSLFSPSINQPREAMLEFMRALQPVDGPVVRPDAPAGLEVETPASLQKWFPGLGMLHVQSLISTVRSGGLPRWEGTRTEGGYLYRSGTGGDRRFYVLVTATAYCRFMPDHDRDEDEVIEHLSTFQVEWQDDRAVA